MNKQSLFGLAIGCVVIFHTQMVHSAEGAEVKFRSPVDVSGSMIRLGNVAEIADIDPATISRLESMTIGPAPAAGAEQTIPFETIRTRLRALGANLSQIEFSGPSVIHVRNGVASTKSRPDRTHVVNDNTNDADRRLAEEMVAEVIRVYVHAKAPDLGEVNVRMQLDTSQVMRVLASGRRGLDVTGGTAPWTGLQQFQLFAFGSGRSGAGVMVRCEIEQRPFVLTVAHHLPRGTIVNVQDLIWKQLSQNEVLRDEELATLVTDPKSVIGYEAVRNLKAGEVLKADVVRPAPLVRTNNVVTVVIERPGINLKRLMKARSDGKLGDTVMLEALEGRERVVATVTGFQEATVQDSATETSGGVPFRGVRVQRGEGVQPIATQTRNRMNHDVSAGSNTIQQTFARVIANSPRPLTLSVPAGRGQ
ncbi:flagellar basal body P-ring formation chaperone FlgA [Calycomorphotria hydatis]|uniref:Flagellar basal body P-ring biosynthesis protein FlgA n=1 Tax=Calycomorphotria hydatis TaxID=2528027 RepID=A0A517TCN4_9PLAN|nr:flagellar basal body P-ring formation chaperone FlgA [Calycomorphotria hydatis]QDT66134.1 flagellar basal body P-ring biosynthesis protein FlgA [Calycomorphotria hydatis]